MILTKYGKKEWGMALAIFLAIFVICATAVFLGFPSVIAGPITGVAALACFGACAFFRDPPRKIAADPSAIVSPADGVIKDVELIKSETLECDELSRLFHDKDILRIGIFLSVFNVHLNRAPWDMKVEFKVYKPGKFLDARDPAAGKVNESMLLGGTCPFEGETFPVAVRQVSGAIARRIVCPVNPGESYARGQIYGMIKFGSRTELYIPAGMGIDVAVNVGESVRAGSSILAFVRPEAKAKLHALAEDAAAKELQ